MTNKIVLFMLCLITVSAVALAGQVFVDPLDGKLKSLPSVGKFADLTIGSALGVDNESKGYEIKYDEGTPSDTSDDSVVGAMRIICNDETNMHFPLLLMSTVDDQGGAVLYQFILNYSLIDDATITMPTGKACWGFILAGDAEEYINFVATSAGVVTLLTDSSTNTANTDSDGDLCVYDGGDGIIIRNRLAGTKVIRGTIWMDD